MARTGAGLIALLLAISLVGGCNPGGAGNGAGKQAPAHTAQAPREKMLGADGWTPGDKQAFGTAFTYGAPPEKTPSKVWFTAQAGAISEVFYPDVNTAAIKRLQFFVQTPGGQVLDTTEDFTWQVTTEPKSLLYTLTGTNKDGSVALTQTLLTDPARDSLLVRAHLTKAPAGSHLLVFVNPHLGGTGTKTSAKLDLGKWTPGKGYAQADGLAFKEGVAMDLVTDVPWVNASASYLGMGSTLAALQAGEPATWYDHAESGRVTLLADLGAVKGPVTVALGFGSDQGNAASAAHGTLADGFEKVKQAYVSGWAGYVQGLWQPPGEVNPLYWHSAMTVRAAMDKTHRGAIIASPSHPWGHFTPDSPGQYGYQAIWPRDLYHATMGLLAAGDQAGAREVLHYLVAMQDADGSFPQNATVDGTPWWKGLQLDEVADPILTAWWLKAQDLYPTLVKKAASFLLEHGPSTPQERWEESGGYSPATLAAEVAGLVAAADMARTAGDTAFAEQCLARADAWNSQIEAWTFVDQPPAGGLTVNAAGGGSYTPPAGQGYYLRIAPTGEPNKPFMAAIANGGGTWDQRSIVDPSFLELVRLGLRAPKNPWIVSTLGVVDATIRVQTPTGPSWFRYNHDGYGDADPKGKRRGRLWTLLSAERGIYELAAGNKDGAVATLRSLEMMAGPSQLLAEQVWEQTGTGTESATPLIWSHGEYLVLTRSLAEGIVFDQPPLVAQRYAQVK